VYSDHAYAHAVVDLNRALFTISDKGLLVPYIMFDKLSDPNDQPTSTSCTNDAHHSTYGVDCHDELQTAWPRSACKVRHSDGGLYCCVGCKEWVTSGAMQMGGSFTGSSFYLSASEATDLTVLTGIYLEGHTQGILDKDGHLRDQNLNSRAGGSGAVWALGRTGRDQWASVRPGANGGLESVGKTLNPLAYPMALDTPNPRTSAHYPGDSSSSGTPLVKEHPTGEGIYEFHAGSHRGYRTDTMNMRDVSLVTDPDSGSYGKGITTPAGDEVKVRYPQLQPTKGSEASTL
jgi:hypothetical protein